MKRFLICLFSFLFVGCSIAGGAVLLTNSSYSDNTGGGSTNDENKIDENGFFPGPEATYWTDSGNYATAFDNEGEAGIDGSTEEKAYEIRTAEQLARLAYLINNSSTNSTYKSLYYVQTADIDLSVAEHCWNSIGTESYHFSGYYDGSKHEILGMDTDPTNSNNGLFGVIQDAEIFNINIGSFGTLVSNSGSMGAVVGNANNSKIYNCSNSCDIAHTSPGRDHTGGIVGYAMTCEIYNCSNSGSINGDSNVGGVVGYAYETTITDCYNTGEVDGDSYVGGVAGRTNASMIVSTRITNCYNTGNITGSDGRVGGVVGYAGSSATITNSYNTGSVDGSHYVGGVVGDAGSSTITNCYNTGSVTMSSSRAAPSPSASGCFGGVVGDAGSSTITNCYNTGSVTMSSSRAAPSPSASDCFGGVVGNAGSSTITNCYNTGVVTGYRNVGGVVGDSVSTIINCYNTGTVDGSSYVGGVVGDSVSTIINCYNTGKVTGDDYVGGVVGRDYNSASTITNCYYGGNCTLSYGIGSSSSNTGASKDENLIANAKSLSWYQDSSKWDSEYPWDFDSTWTFAVGMNDGYPILKYSLKASAITLNPNGGTGGMEVIYLSDNTFYADAGLSEPISKITSLPSWIGHKFEGFYTSPDGGVMVINSEGEIIADISSISSITTLYAQWSTAVSAYYDSEGGYWYIENGRLPQSRVTDSATISALNSSTTVGDVYYIAGMYLGSKVLQGEEYCMYNDVWYKVETIKWRLQYSSSQQVGYATTTETLAIMAEIVYIDAFSDNVLGVGEGYTAESINSFMLYNKIDDSYLKTESRTVDLFGSTTLTTTTSVTSNMFVASYDELSNFTTNALNKTEKVGKTKISDFVKDYLRANGKDAFYYIRDLGSNYNNIKCLGADGGLTQYKAQNKLGIQFSVKYTQYACL